MSTSAVGFQARELEGHEAIAEYEHERWRHWPVNWSAVWVGALAALSGVVVFGLIAVALGAHLVGPEHRVVDLKEVGLWTMTVSIFGAFLAFVVGGWVTGKIAGILRSEPAMLHGAICWLIALPLLAALAALGAGAYSGGWYAGLAADRSAIGEVPFDRPEPPLPGATLLEQSQYSTQLADYRAQVTKWREDTPQATRNAALGTLTAVLLGLVGSVIGGWMASGEPMTLTHYRRRALARPRS